MTNGDQHLIALQQRMLAKRARERRIIGLVFSTLGAALVAAGAILKAAALASVLTGTAAVDIVAAGLAVGGVLLIGFVRFIDRYDDRRPLPPIAQGTRLRRIGE